MDRRKVITRKYTFETGESTVTREVTGTFSFDPNYGADIDNRRGVPMWFVDDITFDPVRTDDEGNMLSHEEQMAATKYFEDMMSDEELSGEDNYEESMDKKAEEALKDILGEEGEEPEGDDWYGSPEKKMIGAIYDTLMGNTDYSQFDPEDVEDQYVDFDAMEIGFTYEGQEYKLHLSVAEGREESVDEKISPKAQKYVSRKIAHLIGKEGLSPEHAKGKAYGMARQKGFDIPGPKSEAYGKIKCPECGVSVPDVPEDSTYEEQLCNRCYEKLEAGEPVGEQVINYRVPMKEAEDHNLRIKSLHDGMAECSAGDWHYTKTGECTREEIQHEFNKHLKQHYAGAVEGSTKPDVNGLIEAFVGMVPFQSGMFFGRSAGKLGVRESKKTKEKKFKKYKKSKLF